MKKIAIILSLYCTGIYSCENEPTYKKLIFKYDQLVKALECGKQCRPLVELLKDDIKLLKLELEGQRCFYQIDQKEKKNITNI